MVARNRTTGKSHERNGDGNALRPHSREAEQSVLGSMLRSNKIIGDIFQIVGPDHFYSDAHQKIATAIRDLHDDGGAVDIVLLAEELKARKQIEDIGDYRYLGELWDAAPTAANAEHYCHIVREKWQRRNVIITASELVRDAQDGRPLDEIHRKLMREIGVLDTDRLDRYRFDPMDSKTFAAQNYRRQYLVRRLAVKGQPMIVGGPRKALKTNLMVDMATSLGSGTKFLNEFEVYVPVRVAVLSGESGDATLHETAMRICRSKEIDLAAVNVKWDFRLPQLMNPEHQKELSRGLRDHGIEVLILDPMYLSLFAGSGPGGPKAENLFDMGPVYQAISDSCISVGTTPVLVTHTKRGASLSLDPLDLDDLPYAGISEYARQWLFISRKDKYDPTNPGSHRLYLNAGGSDGHCGLWILEIEEGTIDENFDGRKWEVRVETASESRQRDEEDKQTKKHLERDSRNKADDATVLNALDRMPDKDGVTATQLRERTDLGKDKFQKSLARLLDDGILEECETFCVVGHGAKRRARGIRRRVAHRNPVFEHASGF